MRDKLPLALQPTPMTDKKPCPTNHKKKYVTKEQANNALGKEWRKGRGKHMPVRVYKCPCGYWHTTSKPNGWWRNDPTPAA